MLFSRCSVAILLALIGVVLSQVVVTVTDTVSVITVTVRPQTTSTSTKYVTVTGGHAPTTAKTVTVTQTAVISSVPSSDSCVVKYFGQCDGDAYNGCNNCDTGLTCVFYTNAYSQCLKPGQQVHPQSSTAPAAVTQTVTIYRN